MTDRKFLAAMLALIVLLSAAWAWQAGKLGGLAEAASARLRDATVAGLTEGPYGTMTREMAERIYGIMRKRPEDRAPEEVAFAYDALRWTGQLDRAEEFVLPSARNRMQFIKRAFELYPDGRFHMLWTGVETGSPPGNANPDRTVAIVTADYWGLVSQKIREEKGISVAGQRWKSRTEYQLVKQTGIWWIAEPIGKELGGRLLEEAAAWPPFQPWPPR